MPVVGPGHVEIEIPRRLSEAGLVDEARRLFAVSRRGLELFERGRERFEGMHFAALPDEPAEEPGVKAAIGAAFHDNIARPNEREVEAFLDRVRRLELEEKIVPIGLECTVIPARLACRIKLFQTFDIR